MNYTDVRSLGNDIRNNPLAESVYREQDWVGLHISVTSGDVFRLQGRDLRGNLTYDTATPTEVQTTGVYNIEDLFLSLNGTLDSVFEDAVATYGGGAKILQSTAYWVFSEVTPTSADITASKRVPTSRYGLFPHTFASSASEQDLGSVYNNFKVGMQRTFEFPQETLIYGPASLGVSTTGVTSTFRINSSSNVVLVKYNAVATGTVTSTFTYTSPALGVAGKPTAYANSTTTTNANNAITVQGLNPGMYSINTVTADNAIQALQIAVVEF